MKNLTLNIENMSCDGCVQTITQAISTQVESIEVILKDKIAKITYDENKISQEDILRYIDIIGYSSSIKE